MKLTSRGITAVLTIFLTLLKKKIQGKALQAAPQLIKCLLQDNRMLKISVPVFLKGRFGLHAMICHPDLIQIR